MGRGRGGAPTHRRTEQELEAEDSWGVSNHQGARACHTGGELAKRPGDPGTLGPREGSCGGESAALRSQAPAWGHVISGGCQPRGFLPSNPSLPGFHPAAPARGTPSPGPWAPWSYLQLLA